MSVGEETQRYSRRKSRFKTADKGIVEKSNVGIAIGKISFN